MHVEALGEVRSLVLQFDEGAKMQVRETGFNVQSTL